MALCHVRCVVVDRGGVTLVRIAGVLGGSDHQEHTRTVRRTPKSLGFISKSACDKQAPTHYE